MRIAIEGSTWVTPRGFGRFTRELTRAIVDQHSAHRVELVLDSGAAQADDLPDGVEHTIVSTRDAVVRAASAGRARSAADMWRMSRALAAARFDWIVFPTAYSYVPVWTRARVAVIVHDALPEMLPALVLGSVTARALWWAKVRLACAQARLIATVSNASAGRLRQYLPVGRRPIVVLTEGAAPVFSAETRREDETLLRTWDLVPNEYVLYVGGLSPHKRVPAVVDACAAQANAGAGTLVLAGPISEDSFHSDAGSVAAAIARARQRGKSVVQTGFVPDETLAALYRHARCLVLASVEEGFGLPALEAMSCGCPVVATRTAALTEVCGDAAEYFDDVAELSGALERVLHNNARRRELARKGIERASHFGWDAAARKLISALEAAT